jgi:hypothetical protein
LERLVNVSSSQLRFSLSFVSISMRFMYPLARRSRDRVDAPQSTTGHFGEHEAVRTSVQ